MTMMIIGVFEELHNKDNDHDVSGIDGNEDANEDKSSSSRSSREAARKAEAEEADWTKQENDVKAPITNGKLSKMLVLDLILLPQEIRPPCGVRPWARASPPGRAGGWRGRSPGRALEKVERSPGRTRGKVGRSPARVWQKVERSPVREKEGRKGRGRREGCLHDPPTPWLPADPPPTR